MGLPKIITTDNGTEFLNELIKHLMELLGAQLSNCTAGDICNTPVEVSSSDSCSKKRSESSTSIPIIKHSNNLSKQYSIEGGSINKATL